MNSEELEQSLRTEFDDYLKKVFDEMREDVSGFQSKIDSAIEQHKAQMEDVFKQFTARFDNKTELDEGFKSSIVEHLRLAKDEGARITAQAVEDAERFDEENRIAPEADFSELRDAISDISKQDSQAEILKALVEHASQFTPRGAFFIIKNDHFVGWRVFGKEEQDGNEAIRDVFFPVSDPTLLSEAVRSLETAEGSFGSDGDDAAYLNRLGFGQPDRMYAIPLIARGRSVAMLYADYGQGGTNVNLEALETLVKVAGLTVELLAAARSSKTPKAEPQETAYQAAPNNQQETTQPEVTYTDTSETESSYSNFDSQAAEDSFSYQSPDQTADPAQEENSFSYQTPVETTYSDPVEDTGEAKPAYQDADRETEFQPVSEEDEDETLPSYSDDYQIETEPYQPAAADENYTDNSRSDFQFETQTEVSESPVATAEPDISQFESFTPQESVETAANDNYAPVATDDYSGTSNDYGSFDTAPSFSNTQTETAVSEPIVAAEPVRSRFSERNVDLPIEVSEDERRLHNDARRFARLLVSEIKLYNEQKVKEGRESSDLYERLREAIDRSREMYDKRVQSPVSAKFDYFHYELVNSLADGDESSLGNSYPGASI